jgi:arginine N-succinyltransferase
MTASRDAHVGPVIFELPGWRDEAGQSPFWQGLGRHFYGGDLDELARQHGPHWRSALALLLPRQPIYTAFLAEPARQAIAQTTLAARGWMDALAHEGLRYSHHVSIVDGGPVFEAHLDALGSGWPD